MSSIPASNNTLNVHSNWNTSVSARRSSYASNDIREEDVSFNANVGIKLGFDMNISNTTLQRIANAAPISGPSLLNRITEVFNFLRPSTQLPPSSTLPQNPISQAEIIEERQGPNEVDLQTNAQPQPQQETSLNSQEVAPETLMSRAESANIAEENVNSNSVETRGRKRLLNEEEETSSTPANANKKPNRE